MSRGRFARDRGSFKSSEVLGLFILSTFGWMTFFAIWYLIGMVLDWVALVIA